MAPVDKDAEIVGGSDRRQKAEVALTNRGARILNDVDFLGLRRGIRAGERPVLLACPIEDNRQVVEVRDFILGNGIGSTLFAQINGEPVRLHARNQQFVFGMVENLPTDKAEEISGDVAHEIKGVTEK